MCVCVCKAVLQTIYFSTQTGIRTLAIILAFKVCFAFRPPAQVKNLGVFLPKKVSPHSKFQTASSDIKPCLCWNAPEVTRTGAFQDMARCNSRHVWCRFECRKKWLVFFRVAKLATRRKHARHGIDLTLVFCLGYIPDSKREVAILRAQLCVEDHLAWFRCGSVSKPCTPGEHQNSW